MARVRMFDLLTRTQHHHLRRPTASPTAAPLLEQAGPQLLGHYGYGWNGGENPTSANLGPATPLQPGLVDPGERFSADGSFLPEDFWIHLEPFWIVPTSEGVGGARRGRSSVWELRPVVPRTTPATHSTALPHPNVRSAETEKT